MDRRRSYNRGRRINFSRAAAASDYYSPGAHAAKVEQKKDEVSLKYYVKMKKIEKRTAAAMGVPKIICAIIICACAIAVIFAQSKVYNYQLENSRLNTELENAREKTVSIIAQSTERIDLAYVEAEAQSRLNMSKPQSYQIVYIEVPKTDYTITHDAYTVVEKEKRTSASYKELITGLKETKQLLIGESEKDGGEAYEEEKAEN